MPNTFDVIIIGAGAAGLHCAATAGYRGRSVLVLDHANKAGKKILMSGGGRCNFTNLNSTPAQFLSANPPFCISALKRYTPFHFLELVERHGIAHVEKAAGQLFCRDSSRDIVDMLLTECAWAGAEVRLNTSVTAIEPRDQGFTLTTRGRRLSCGALVIATGGLSIPKMGASGFGYGVARQFGLNVLPTRAGLVPFTLHPSEKAMLAPLAGVSLPVTARCGGASFREPMLITHRGLSGPAMLQISSFWGDGDTLDVDLLPEQDCRETLPALRKQQPNLRLDQHLANLLPKRFAQTLSEQHGWGQPLQQFGNKALAAVAGQLHHWRIKPAGTEGYRTAEVTLGGVDTSQLSSKTMAASTRPDLFFIGEVVDVTGHLGGHNFQWAWASAVAAGLAV